MTDGARTAGTTVLLRCPSCGWLQVARINETVLHPEIDCAQDGKQLEEAGKAVEPKSPSIKRGRRRRIKDPR
jgi:hypothetical protein